MANWDFGLWILLEIGNWKFGFIIKLFLKTIIILFVIIIIAVTLLISSYFYIQKEIKTPFAINGAEKIFIIQKGESAKTIAKKMENGEIIKNKWFFLFYLWQTGNETKLQAGSYALSPRMAIPEIAETIIKGKVIDESIEITIPEGLRSPQIATILKKSGLIENESDFLNILAEVQLPRLFGSPTSEKLEGYLFPDTYKFEKDSTPEQIAEKMLENFQKQINASSIFPSPFVGEGWGEGSLHEIIIMASILEKEVRSKEDMEIASGILWKRIDASMPLQVDATIAYITGKKTGEITYDDLKVESPFNTYTNKGLPPSPISNPGLQAIEAAANPKKGDYWYYLSKPTGETVFSRTLQEHNINKIKYLK